MLPSTCLCSESRRSARAIGPRSIAELKGSPTRRDLAASTNDRSNSSAIFQNEAFCSQADLTCVVEPAPDSSRNSLRNVGVFADDECVGPSQLHYGFLDYLPGFGSDCGTCPHAAGYGGTLNTPIIDDVDDVVSLENQILKDTFREAGFQHDQLELE